MYRLGPPIEVRGTVLAYRDPQEPVGEDNWEALRMLLTKDDRISAYSEARTLW